MIDYLRRLCSTFVIRGGGALLGLVLNMAVARSYGVTLSGEFYQAYYFSSLLISICMMGLGYVIVHKVTPFFNEQKSNSLGNVLFSSSFYAVLIAVSLVSGVIILFSDFFSNYVFHEAGKHNVLYLTLCILLPGSISALYAELLKALKEPNRSIIVANILCNGIFVCFIFLRKTKSVITILEMYIIANWIAVGCIWLLNKKIFERFKVGFVSPKSVYDVYLKNKELVRNFWSENFSLMSINLANAALGMLDALVIGIMMTSSDVAIYSVANKIASRGSLILTTVNTIVGYQFADKAFLGDNAGLRKIMIRYTRIMAVLGFLFFIGMMFFPMLIPFLFGVEFYDSIKYTRLLAIGQLVMIITGPSAYFLIMTGKIMEYRKITILSAMLCVILNIILVKKFGIYGAVFTNIATLFSKNVWGFIYVLKFAKISVYDFFVDRESKLE